ncbi:MAG: hypothetical protein ACW987_10600 [Candidatus Thorarchaeota archaeon]
MKVGEKIEPKWFRKTGPIAADYINDRVYYRKELLKGLRSLVSNNSFSMLEGIAATGKTVLARQLGYEFYDKDKVSVYYFDSGLERDFDMNELVNEINSTAGVFILENVHLETRKIQRLCSKVRRHKNRNILFTTRPSFRENLNKEDVGLDEIESIYLEPFDQVDEIIEHFASHHTNVSWSEQVRDLIKDVSARSFWLLSYALKGHVDGDGKGSPRTWVAKGARNDLRELEKLECSFPEVLVSLSPLYQSEVLTEESFLRENLGFEHKTLQRLVCRGDITQQDNKDGYVLYGLPHSALASLYWEFGGKCKIRRRISEYEDFVYEYVTSKVTNGLEALTSCNPETQEKVTLCLIEECRVAEIVENEQSMEAIFWAIYHMSHCHENRDWLTSSLLEVLASKIQSTDDLYHAADCLHTILNVDRGSFGKLWASLELDALARALTTTGHFYGAYKLLLTVSCVETRVSRAFCQMINLDDLLRAFRRSTDFAGICSFIRGLFLCDKNQAYELWSLLDARELAGKMSTASDVFMALKSLCSLFRMDPKIGNQLWSFVDKRDLATTLCTREDVQYIGAAITYVLETDKNIAQELCKLFDLRELAGRLSDTPLLTLLEECIDVIYQIDSDISKNLCSFLDLKKLAITLNQKNEDYVHSVLDTIDKANRKVGNELRKLLAARSA